MLNEELLCCARLLHCVSSFCVELSVKYDLGTVLWNQNKSGTNAMRKQNLIFKAGGNEFQKTVALTL